MAIGTAALVLILSVYNGFDKIIVDNLSDLSPDLLITSAGSKYFKPEAPAFKDLANDPDISSVSEVLQEDVFVSYGEKQGLATAKGVDSVYEQGSSILMHMYDGKFKLHDEGMPVASVGSGLASEMGIKPHFLDKLSLFYPDLEERLPLLGPGAALNCVRVTPGSIFSINSSVDNSLVILPVETMRELLGKGDIVTGVEVRLAHSPGRKYIKALSARLGPDYKVLDRYSQNPSIYKMMRYEKFAVYMILIFVVIIVAFNILGSLSMLMIEKEDDMKTLRALGARDRLVRQIFVLEGWMISLLGLAAGLVIGIGLSLLQLRFGLIKMPGGFMITSYPVVLKAADILWTAVGVALIGLVVAIIPASKTAESN